MIYRSCEAILGFLVVLVCSQGEVELDLGMLSAF